MSKYNTNIMIENIESIPELFESPTYNFLETFLTFAGTETRSIDQRKLICTLELFTFGNYFLYKKYSGDFLRLEKNALTKLLELSILSFISLHENTTVSIREFLDNKFGIYLGIDGLKAETEDAYIFLERILISMIDKDLIEIMIDDEHNSIIIRRAKLIRDAFNPSVVQLNVLHEEDLIDINVNRAKGQLKKWLENHVAPVKVDLESFQVEDSKKIPISRKRKSSDNAK